MTKLSATNIAHLNNSMKAAQDVSLGTLLSSLESASATLTAAAVVTGGSTLTSVHTNASAITFNTGLGSITGFTARVSKSGSEVASYVLNSSGSLTFAANSSGSYVMAAGDVVSWIAW